MPKRVDDYATMIYGQSVSVSPILTVNGAGTGEGVLARNKRSKLCKKTESKSSETPSAESDFFGDLSNYMPLGSLSIVQDEAGGPSEWEQPDDSLKYIPIDHPIYVHVYGLLRSRRIRIHFRRHQLMNHVVTVRFHVLPGDVGRQFQDPDDVKARRSLIKLMECVDHSLESWEGRNSTPCQMHTYQPGEVSTDSLFYLFNTLPSPSPSSSRMSSPVAKKAMALLLNKDSNIPGLKTTLYAYQKRSAAAMIQRETEPLHTLDPRLESLKGPTDQIFYYDRGIGVILHDTQTYEEARGGILAEVECYPIRA